MKSKIFLLVLIQLATQSLLAAPTQTVNCVDVRLNKNVKYNSCQIHENAAAQLQRDEAYRNMMIMQIKKGIEESVAENWRPPMGFSGYRVDVSYSVSPFGTFERIDVRNYYMSDELKASVLAAFKASEPVYIPNDERLRGGFINLKSHFKIK